MVYIKVVWFAEETIIFQNSIIDLSYGRTMWFLWCDYWILGNIYINFRIELTKRYVFMQWVGLPTLLSPTVVALIQTYLYGILQYL